MLDNNLIFSLILSFICSVIYYMIKYNRDNKQIQTIKNDTILIFSIIFVCSFLIKLCSSSGNDIKHNTNINTITHSSRPPF
jgi:hypothetical protein